MKTLNQKRTLLAAASLACGLVPATAALAQGFAPQANSSGCAPASFGPGVTSLVTDPRTGCLVPGRTVAWTGPITGRAPNGSLIVTYPSPPARPAPANPYSPIPYSQWIASYRPPVSSPPPPPRPPQARDVGYGVAYTNGPCASTTSGAVMSPCVGPTGSQIRLQLTRPLTATPGRLIFSAVPTPGVPSGVVSGLIGSGSNYSASVPAALCQSGGGTWYVYLRLSNQQDMGLIGSYTPTNCRG